MIDERELRLKSVSQTDDAMISDANKSETDSLPQELRQELQESAQKLRQEFDQRFDEIFDKIYLRLQIESIINDTTIPDTNKSEMVSKILINNSINAAEIFINEESGMTLLHYAAQKGWDNFLQNYFLDSNNKHYIQDLKDKEQKSVIEYARKENKFATIQMLFTYAIDSLRQEVYQRNEEVCQRIQEIRKEAHQLNLKTDEITPIDEQKLKLDSVSEMIKSIIDDTTISDLNKSEMVFNLLTQQSINAVDVFINEQLGITLLHYAAQKGWDSFLQNYFLDLSNRHYIQDLKDEYQESVLIYALKTDNSSTISILLSSTTKKLRQEDFLPRQNLKPEEIVIKRDGNTHRGYTLLHYAAGNGWDDFLRSYFSIKENLSNVNLNDNEGSTLVEYAAGMGHLSTVKLLIDFGADFKGKTGLSKIFFKTPRALHVAAEYGRDPVVEFLLEKGANPNDFDERGFSSLFYAVKEGHFQIVVRLLGRKNISPEGNVTDTITIDTENLNSDIYNFGPSDKSIFYYVVRSNNRSLVKLFSDIDKYLIQNKKFGLVKNTKFGFEDLLYAVENKLEDSVKYILDFWSFDKKIVNKVCVEDHKTLLHYALDSQNSRVKNSSINLPFSEMQLIATKTEEAKTISILQDLIAAQADIKATTKSGRPVLEYAFFKRSSKIILDYLFIQSDPKDKCMTLLYTLKYGNKEFSFFEHTEFSFDKNEVDITTIKDKSGMTPLHYAVIQENTDMVAKLLSFGFSICINQPDIENITPLICAAKEGSDTTMNLLLAYHPYITHDVLELASKNQNLSSQTKEELNNRAKYKVSCEQLETFKYPTHFWNPKYENWMKLSKEEKMLDESFLDKSLLNKNL